MDIFNLLRRTAENYRRPLSIALFGLGRTNTALLRELVARGYTDITVRCDGALPLPEGVIGKFGKDARRDLREDVMIFSPSVRREGDELIRARAEGAIFTSDCELFFDTEPERVFAVSGSDGKSTTCAMTARLLDTRYGGVRPSCNFGVPFAELPACDAYAVELSSFNLQYLSPKVLRGAVTNITPNHLNWHRDMEEYIEAKLGLLRGASEPITNADDETLRQHIRGEVYGVFSLNKGFGELKSQIKAQVYYTADTDSVLRNGQRLIGHDGFRLPGQYNLYNLLCALALTDGHRDEDGTQCVIDEFRPLPHRATELTDGHGRRYINSSIDTTPARTCATLTALGTRVGIILGGTGKGLPLGRLTQALATYASAIGLYGEEGKRLLPSLAEATDCPIACFDRMTEAVDFVTESCSDTVLLSPASTSYGEFSDYEARGRAFENYIRLKNNAEKGI